MGDRANVAIKTGEGDRDHVWLYSHWGGRNLPSRLLTAMKSPPAQGRLNDSSYLCRILLDRLIEEHEGETGYGVSHDVCDNEYPILEVDVPLQVIRIREFDREAWSVDWKADPLFEMSFKDFSEMDEFHWECRT